MVLIALQVYQGSGDKNGLTLNRILATITGVLMAILISFLPPHVNGRNPKYSRAYLDALDDAFMLLLQTFVNEKESSKIMTDDFKKSYLAKARSKLSFATFALNDADMWQRLPFMRINKDLRPALDQTACTEAMIDHLREGFSTVLTKNINVNETRTSVSQFLDEFESNGGIVLTEQPDPSMMSDVTIGWCYEIAHDISVLRDQLDRIEAEYGNRWTHD